MTIFEIDQRMNALVDPETGELAENAIELMEELQMERDMKLDNICCWYKDLLAEAKAIEEQKKILDERMKAKKNKAEALKKLLETALNGEKFESPRCRVTYRKSVSTEVRDPYILAQWLERNGYFDCVVQQEPKFDSTAVKKLLNEGYPVDGAALVEKNNIQIK